MESKTYTIKENEFDENELREILRDLNDVLTLCDDVSDDDRKFYEQVAESICLVLEGKEVNNEQVDLLISATECR